MDGPFGMRMAFPVDGEPWVELEFEGEQWADLQLEGVDLDATGRERTANARAMICLYPPWSSGRDTSWRFEFDDARAQLERAARRKWWWTFGVAEAFGELRRARNWLLENEYGREPLTETEGLTAAGAAASKMSRRELERFLGDLGPAETAGDEPATPEDDESVS